MPYSQQLPTKLQALFIFFAALFCLLTFIEPFDYSWIPKVIPMAILIWAALPLWQNSSSRYFLIGLLFSVAGDILLAVQQGALFVFGLSAFLIAHLFYLAFLMPARLERATLPKLIPYVVFALVMVPILVPHLGELLGPVVVYMLVLMLMGMAALVSQKSNKWLVLGGISFIISDSIIGLNKFVVSIPSSHFAIMVTYYFAQYALLTGALVSSQKQAAEK